MPTITEERIDGLAFCVDGRCPGYEQQPVPAVRRLNEFSYRDLGGDIPGIERSTIDVVFVDPDHDGVCGFCGKPRLVSDQERPEYPNTSGRDPLEIYHRGQAAGQMRELMGSQENERLKRELEASEMRAALAQQATRMEQMAGLLERQATVIDELQSRPRGPGRPRKVEDEE